MKRGANWVSLYTFIRYLCPVCSQMSVSVFGCQIHKFLDPKSLWRKSTYSFFFRPRKESIRFSFLQNFFETDMTFDIPEIGHPLKGVIVSSLNRNLRRLRTLVSLDQIAFTQYEHEDTGRIVWQVWEVEHSREIGKYYLRRLIAESSTQEAAVKEAVRRFRTMRFHEIWDEVGDQKEV